MNDTTSTAHHSSNVKIFGVLMIIGGSFTAFVALGEKSRIAVIAGAVIAFAGIILAMIGDILKKRRARQ